MIDFITGHVREVKEKHLSVVAEGTGISFFIQVPSPFSYQTGEKVELHVLFIWQPEKGPLFIGARTSQELLLCSFLMGVQGVGSSLALSLMSQMSNADLVRAINEVDIRTLSSLNGIGAKKAEQICHSLKGKLDAVHIPSGASPSQGVSKLNDTLVALGYSRQECQQALSYLSSLKQEMPFDLLLRTALSFLSNK